MALEVLRNKVYTFSQRNATFALTPNEMYGLDITSSSYTLNSLYVMMSTALQPYSITVIKDTVNNALVFVPNSRTAKGLISTLASSTPPMAPVYNAPATYTSPVIYSNTTASVMFTGNPNQKLSRPMLTDIMQQNNYVSFWLKDNVYFYIGTYNDPNYPTFTDNIYVTGLNGVVMLYIKRSWIDQNTLQLKGCVYQLNVGGIRTNRGFNHYIVGVGPNNSHCYINGNYYPIVYSSGSPKPLLSLSGMFVIGQSKLGSTTAGSLCKVKNISIFPSTYGNNDLIDDIYRIGENGDIRNIGLQASHYWKLNGNTGDLVDSTYLSEQLTGYTF